MCEAQKGIPYEVGAGKNSVQVGPVVYMGKRFEKGSVWTFVGGAFEVKGAPSCGTILSSL